MFHGVEWINLAQVQSQVQTKAITNLDIL